jgi:hypothetical protein
MCCCLCCLFLVVLLFGVFFFSQHRCVLLDLDIEVDVRAVAQSSFAEGNDICKGCGWDDCICSLDVCCCKHTPITFLSL